MLESLQMDFRALTNSKRARLLARFFKTGKGQYGEGDKFLGIMVPEQRNLARKYQDLSLVDLQRLLNSGFHEQRLTALFILIFQYQKAKKNAILRQEIVNFYLKNTKNINNWDLVDLSAPKILGDFLLNNDRKILYAFAKSRDLWERRIAVLATFAFIKENQFADALKISELLLEDKHDLIHKAVGWMLREIGKKDLQVEEIFLKKHCQSMPRTMLRYAIEKFEPVKKSFYMGKRA
ncbi:MAG: alkylation repair enzyme superfamily protein [Candidatus Peregrinibacteria bacterium GW2011_GWF2_33_10]|nr:MAG: alkylation repair enzyme superfamily protein [Candidatus Peregrinibacteria bacterium GW2011_GWF2_33_10]OGJ45213.1 MAG: DNA alkylation repair protein [Candidatus Peregrinibacteria bacterium RIFOXYA2_FULL_33_21]OGJ46465.1 MAG: DNA alkylation repair protein [Candidatus Peregrinibacteria bacterium RIFOXYA12_FULL_33_12]OGJ51137.1 MAG: DNA alkylation repair protein [Candidatus Peregrinibacteria bacterium RIFOXYB2_FULL_33_20]